MGKNKNLLSELVIFFIRGYKFILSPMLGTNCRFEPTCSQYAIEVYNKFGFFKSSCLVFKRIFRCNPFCIGGEDPVPSGNADKNNITKR